MELKLPFNLPWSLSGYPYPDIEDSTGNIIAETLDADVAEYIIQAVNHHAELLLAVQCLIANPVISGMSAAIRDSAAERRVIDPLDFAKKVVAKIV